MMTCKICSRPDRAAIDKAIVDQRSLRDIAGQYGVSRSAVDRHKPHIPKALSKAKQAETVAESTSLLSRVEKLMARCEHIYETAIEAGELTGAVGATREIRGCLELLAKLSGELKPGGVTVNNNLSLSATVERMTNEELEDAIGAFVIEHGIGLVEVRKSILFDEVTVAPPENIETCRRHEEMMAELAAAEGKPIPGRKPWRNASPDDRYRMLLAAWKRETGEDLPERLDDLGSRVVIEINFDFAEKRDWLAWPTVRL